MGYRRLMYKTRFYNVNNGSSIKLEQCFWDVIDELSSRAGIKWSEWVDKELIDKPERVGRATWLRRQTVSTLRNSAAA
jgi:predicted DNA-binding ribbon-helix-helix protein